ncbi:MAG TPA: tripartite tricarboxylate transporter substrate-binding protein [Pseudolabrys sp.]|nr:tripartite tricarboxylate transporter substrate-binding protein [Pseudolabrys sp.]
MAKAFFRRPIPIGQCALACRVSTRRRHRHRRALSEHLGQQFIIENRPGASGNVATQAVGERAVRWLHVPKSQV